MHAYALIFHLPVIGVGVVVVVRNVIGVIVVGVVVGG